MADEGAGVPELERESMFERVADWVSAAMGRPTNIVVWLILVVAWTAIFALHIVSPAGTFLPAWFTGTGYNFPLNLMTTVAELFIGFLVAAAANRSERILRRILAQIQEVLDHLRQVDDDDLAADQESRTMLRELRTDFAIMQRQHAEQGRILAALLAQTGSTVDAQVGGGAGSNPAVAGLPADERMVPPPAVDSPNPEGGS